MEESTDTTRPKEDYTCERCLKTYKRAAALANHQHKNLCNGIPCPNCKKTFSRQRELDRHIQKSLNIPCDHCERHFCSRDELEKHKRQIKPVEPPSDDSINEVIFPSLFEGIEKYEAVKRVNYGMIKDFIDTHNRYIVINNELPPNYTYGNLQQASHRHQIKTYRSISD